MASTFLLVVPAAWVWSQVAGGGGVAAAWPWMIGGIIGGFIMALVTIFKKEWAPVTAPIYAALEGLALGGLSAVLEAQSHGVVLQAVALTFATLIAMLVAYRPGSSRSPTSSAWASSPRPGRSRWSTS